MNKTIENLKKLKSFHNGSYGADIDKAIKSLEFAEWVAEEIFSDEIDGKEFCDYEFEEVACRKLEKLGIVRKTETDWELADKG